MEGTDSKWGAGTTAPPLATALVSGHGQGLGSDFSLRVQGLELGFSLQFT